MSTARLLPLRGALRASLHLPRTTFPRPSIAPAVFAACALTPPQRRHNTIPSHPSAPASNPTPTKQYTFDDVRPSLPPCSSPSLQPPPPTNSPLQIKSLSTSPTPTRILIDVREPHEYTAGHIPTALNVPIASQPDGLFLPADEFATRFGFEKPKHDDEVVFYCKAGVRSAAAAGIARQAGWGRVGEYKGSWGEWERKGGERAS